MKQIKYIISAVLLLLISSCSNTAFIDDLYVAPKASFTVSSTEVEAFTSVKFTNTGTGEYYAVYTGDDSHVYGETGNSGFAANSDGTYSYAYTSPGVYTVVWVASSIKASGEVAHSVDSTKVTVIATDGGLSSFSITKMIKMTDFGSSFFYESYGEFASNYITCPMPYQLWTKGTLAKAVGVKFTLDSSLATLYWSSTAGDTALTSESTTKLLNFYSGTELVPQTLKVITKSGYTTDYEVAAVLIPEFTIFTINGVSGTITRDISAFNKFNMTVDLPDGTDLTTLVPNFVVMANDTNLINNDTKVVSVTANSVKQTSGVSSVDFTKTVEYVITYSVTSNSGHVYTYNSIYEVTVK
jgi:hypothetical protein